MLRTRIKEARKLQKLSQAALGKLIGLTGAEISRIECGYRDVSPAEVTALARALGLKEDGNPPGSGTVTTGTAASGPSMVLSSGGSIPSPKPLQSAAERLPAAPPQLSGSNLDDPANFQEIPDLTLLNPGGLDPNALRAQLIAASSRATKILHTSRVPAAIWVAWRDFDREAHRILRRLPPG